MEVIILLLGVGLLVGALGRRIVPWREPENPGISMGAGVTGAFAGAFVAHLIGYDDGTPPSFVAASVGAIVLVAVYQALAGRRRTA
ncbi:MAG TPA: GlsB/YeaQ/YmgE family stress response membrane protein [Polyangiaceae bacterium]